MRLKSLKPLYRPNKLAIVEMALRSYNLRMRKLFLPIFLVLIGCFSDKQPREFEGISNEGILTLSSYNSTLGSNEFLSSEIKRSEALRYFIKGRGAPHAIKVQDHKMRPTEMVLYYPREKSFYTAELDSTLIHYDWIVRGPYKMRAYDDDALARINLDLRSEPLLVIDGETKRVRPKPPPSLIAEKPKVTPAVIALPTPKPTPAKPVVKKKPVAKPKATTPKVVATPPPFKPLNFDQMAILMSQGFAERDTNGDVIHTVTKEGETLVAIAGWYAGDKKKAADLAKASNVSATEKLKVGDRIRIPYAIVKNTKQMK